MKVRVYAGLIGRLLFGRGLRRMRFSLKKEPGVRYYQRHIDDNNKDELRRVVKYCRHRLLPCKVTEDRMERRQGYRSRFFRETKGVFGSSIYLCAYCGRPLSSKNTCVDHIIPVKKASGSRFYQRILFLLRIKNVNDIRNLAPSCMRCNLEKSSHGGLWVIRGYLGRSWVRVLIKETVLLILGSVLLYWLYRFLVSYIDKDTIVRISDFIHHNIVIGNI